MSSFLFLSFFPFFCFTSRLRLFLLPQETQIQEAIDFSKFEFPLDKIEKKKRREQEEAESRRKKKKMAAAAAEKKKREEEEEKSSAKLYEVDDDDDDNGDEADENMHDNAEQKTKNNSRRVTQDQFQMLKNSEELRSMLKDSRLQRIILSIDKCESDVKRTWNLEQALNNVPEFAAFVRKMMETIQAN